MVFQSLQPAYKLLRAIKPMLPILRGIAPPMEVLLNSRRRPARYDDSTKHRLITSTGIGNEIFTHHHPCNASGFVTHAHKKSFTVHYTIALTVYVLKYAYAFTICSQSADYTCKMFTCDNYTCCQCVHVIQVSYTHWWTALHAFCDHSFYVVHST